MKAIKIPNTGLLDVFGRAVTTNTQDLHRFSNSEQNQKIDLNNHVDHHSKTSNATASGMKLNNAHQLTMIGMYSSVFYEKENQGTYFI